MRMRAVGAAAVWLVAAPAFAQSPKAVTGPWTLTPNNVMCTNVPVAAKPVPRLVVRGPHNAEAALTATPGTDLIIVRSADDGLAPGQRYFTARIYGDERRFPRPGEGFGDIRLTGVVTVTAVDAVNAIARLDVACDSVEAGDFLEPFVETTLPSTATDLTIEPDFSDRAALLFGSDHRVLVGLGDIVSIDRGTLHGVVPGERYAFYRDKRNGLPLIYLGEAVVMTTGELTSKVMVTRSDASIEAGDIAVPRRVRDR